MSIFRMTGEAAKDQTRRYMASARSAIFAFQNGATVGDAFGLPRLQSSRATRTCDTLKRKYEAARQPEQLLGMAVTLWTELARASNSAGDEIILRTRNELFEIRYNGLELMSNLSHQSEDILAKRSLRLHGAPARRIFIGGLGMGFTLRTALKHMERDAEIVVCELIPEIVEWNRTHLGHLADHPLQDPRVKVRVGDAMEVLAEEREPFDVILMDTDNGPDFTVRAPNEAIYQSSGIGQIKQALKPGGIGGFWSATSSPAFEQELNKTAWYWRRDEVPLISGRVDAFHYIYFASESAARVGFLQAG